MAVRLESFSKTYGTIMVLEVPDLTWDPGLYWIKGENGSGKSTLLKSMAGLVPFEGDVILGDTLSLKKHPVDYRRHVNYSEAEPLYPGFLTGRDLVQFVARCKQAQDNQVVEIVSALGVHKFMLQSTGTYSSGMLKKLSLSIAFLGNPMLILLDEPLITLDDQARENFHQLVKSKLREDVVILMSSHQSVETSELPITGRFEIREKALIEC